MLFAATTCVFAIYVPGISTVLGIVGGLGCVAIAYIIPLMAFLKTHRDKVKEGHLYILISSVLVAIGFGAALKSVLEVVMPKK